MLLNVYFVCFNDRADIGPGVGLRAIKKSFTLISYRIVKPNTIPQTGFFPMINGKPCLMKMRIKKAARMGRRLSLMG